MASVFARYRSLRSAPDRGATAVEYGLMTLLIAIAIVGAVTLLGANLTDLFTDAAGMFP
ncbi:MAG: Flp family type IVb pilin [Dactylosporangium sp.]|nr:Flp family type IVb pilin [Dactylosporangium sp.]NNJ61647.1 Flp family type IVb pilin [Dactylosporangium sp.]